MRTVAAVVLLVFGLSVPVLAQHGGGGSHGGGFSHGGGGSFAGHSAPAFHGGGGMGPGPGYRSSGMARPYALRPGQRFAGGQPPRSGMQGLARYSARPGYGRPTYGGSGNARPAYQGNGRGTSPSNRERDRRDRRGRSRYGYGYGNGLAFGFGIPWLDYGPGWYGDDGYGYDNSAAYPYVSDPGYSEGYEPGYGPDEVGPDDGGRYADNGGPSQAAQSSIPSTAPAMKRDAVTLVFKDGRPTEHIYNYILSDKTLSVWDSRHQEIPLSELDLAATEKANHAAGVEFQVPRGGGR